MHGWESVIELLWLCGLASMTGFGHQKNQMTFEIIVHEAEEGGFWAEVPAMLGCATEGETLLELLLNMHEAITAWSSVSEEIS